MPFRDMSILEMALVHLPLKVNGRLKGFSNVVIFVFNMFNCRYEF